MIQFEVPIYDYEVMVLVADNPVSIQPILDIGKHEIYSNASDLINNHNTRGRTYRDGGIIIIIKNNADTLTMITTLVHECLHAANMILEAAGVKCDGVNDEASAYLMEFIFAKSLPVLGLKITD